MVAAYSLLHETRAIHAGAVRAGTLHGAGRQDDYKPAIAEAYKQLGHIYRTRGLKETAADYYRKAIGFIEENNLNKFSLPILYSELATVLIDTGRYEEAAEELEKGKARLTLPEYIWPLKLKQVILYSRTGRSAEARTLFDQIRQGHDGYLTTASLTEAQLAINLAEHEFGRALTTLDKLIGLFKETGHSETYFYELFQTRAETYAETGNYEAAYKSQKHYLDLYRKKVGDDNEKPRRIRHAARRQPSRRRKAELQRQTQEVRLHRTQLGIAALSVILLLTVLFLLFTARMNRRLAHAKRAAEASSRMKGVFIRNITHEINTPLNSIVGFAELAAAPDADDEERQSTSKSSGKTAATSRSSWTMCSISRASNPPTPRPHWVRWTSTSAACSAFRPSGTTVSANSTSASNPNAHNFRSTPPACCSPRP
ncbi:MAG: histidine kinase dimerization/phospho-acceptor domain-containing protein [Alistipes finegoldii]